MYVSVCVFEDNGVLNFMWNILNIISYGFFLVKTIL